MNEGGIMSEIDISSESLIHSEIESAIHMKDGIRGLRVNASDFDGVLGASYNR